jgi:tRNA(fMet)-specific endonuclease VapC
MRFLLDTNAISDAMKKGSPVLQRLKEHSPDDLAVSTVTRFEMEAGFAFNPAVELYIRPMAQLLLSAMHLLPFEDEDALSAGKVRAYLRRQGTPIGPYDVLIAGMALRRNLILVTANTSEFSRVPGLRLENWREPVG